MNSKEFEIKPVKYELIDSSLRETGVIGEINHNRIVNTLVQKFGKHLENKKCEVFSLDVPLKINNDTFYPDITIANILYSNSYEMDEPLLIIEIDVWRKENLELKQSRYQSLESLQEYAVINKDDYCVEIFRRKNNWQADEEYYFLDKTVYFESVDLSLSVKDIFRKVLSEEEIRWLILKDKLNTALSFSDFEKRKALLETLTQEATDFTDGYVHLGDMEFDKKDYTKSLSLYEHAYKNNWVYKFINDKNNKEILHEEIGWYHDGCRPFFWAVEGIGLCHWKLGNFKESIKYFELEKKFVKNDDYRLLGVLYFQTGNDKKAKKYLSSCSEWDDSSAYNLALFYFKKKELVKAVTELRWCFIRNLFIGSFLLGRCSIYTLRCKYGLFDKNGLFDENSIINHTLNFSQKYEEEALEYIEDCSSLWKNTYGAMAFLRKIYNHPTVKAEIENRIFKKIEFCNLEAKNIENEDVFTRIIKEGALNRELTNSINDESSKNILDDLKLTR